MANKPEHLRELSNDDPTAGESKGEEQEQGREGKEQDITATPASTPATSASLSTGTGTDTVMSDEARSCWLDTVHTIMIAAYNTNPEQSTYKVKKLMELSAAQGQSFTQDRGVAGCLLDQDSRFHKFGRYSGWGLSMYTVMSDEARSCWLDTVHTILTAAYNTNPEQSKYRVPELIQQSDAQGQSFTQSPPSAGRMLSEDSRFHQFGKRWGLSVNA